MRTAPDHFSGKSFCFEKNACLSEFRTYFDGSVDFRLTCSRLRVTYCANIPDSLPHLLGKVFEKRGQQLPRLTNFALGKKSSLYGESVFSVML